MNNYIPSQSSFLKLAIVAIAIPRYAGAFALAIGFVIQDEYHAYLSIAEFSAGVAMAILEGWAITYILSKWQLLNERSVSWYLILFIMLLTALALPIAIVPYFYLMQAGLTNVESIFSSFEFIPGIYVQNFWNFTIAFLPMLIVIALGITDFDPLAKEKERLNLELEVERKRAEQKIELGQLRLQVKKEDYETQLEIARLEKLAKDQKPKEYSREEKMIIRREGIAKAINNNPLLTKPQLAEQFQASLPTIKTDIEYLIETGLLNGEYKL